MMTAPANLFAITAGPASPTTTVAALCRKAAVDRLRKECRGYQYQACYDDPASVRGILEPMPRLAEYHAKASRLNACWDRSTDTELLGRMPVLEPDQEVHLFRRMNYRMHRIAARIAAAGDNLTPAGIRRLRTACNADIRAAKEDRELLAAANIGLVLSEINRMGRRGQVGGHSEVNRDDVVSIGQLTLVKTIRSFNYAHGWKFSTYFTNSLRRNVHKFITHQMDRAAQQSTANGFSESCDVPVYDEPAFDDSPNPADVLTELMDRLTERECKVLHWRHGVGTTPKTCHEIGGLLGISKERVRQIQLRATLKLRQIAEETGLMEKVSLLTF